MQRYNPTWYKVPHVGFSFNLPPVKRRETWFFFPCSPPKVQFCVSGCFAPETHSTYFFCFVNKKKKNQKEKRTRGEEGKTNTKSYPQLQLLHELFMIYLFHCFGGNMEWEKRTKKNLDWFFFIC